VIILLETSYDWNPVIGNFILFPEVGEFYSGDYGYFTTGVYN